MGQRLKQPLKKGKIQVASKHENVLALTCDQRCKKQHYSDTLLTSSQNSKLNMTTASGRENVTNSLSVPALGSSDCFSHFGKQPGITY